MMPGDALVALVVLIFGCAAFFFGVIYMICRAFAWVGRGLWGMAGRSPLTARPAGDPVRTASRNVCSRDGCRRVENRRGASFCSRCGAPLAGRS